MHQEIYSEAKLLQIISFAAFSSVSVALLFMASALTPISPSEVNPGKISSELQTHLETSLHYLPSTTNDAQK